MVVAAFAALTLVTTTVTPAAASTGQAAGDTARSRGCHAGAPGVGDDYHPLYGNGGYDVAHYPLKISYNPATDRLWSGWRRSRPGRPRRCAGSTLTSRG
jgi:hypothetical protein